MNCKKDFSGCQALFFGDSITAYNQHYTKGYHHWVQELLGLADYRNYGISGYEVHRVYQKVLQTQDTAELVCIMCGTNDVNHGIPFGTLSDRTPDTTCGALHALCALLQERFPDATVVFITPHYQERYIHPEGVTNGQIADAILNICPNYGFPVYDCYRLSGIRHENLSELTQDGCHWNDLGHALVGKKLAEFLQTI